MKTLRDFQDELAQERMDTDFEGILGSIKMGFISPSTFTVFCNDASERYAQYMFTEGAKAQRILCAESATLEPNGMMLQVDKDSILNCELATHPQPIQTIEK